MLVAEKKKYSYSDILYEQERENKRINKRLEQQKKKRAKIKKRLATFKVVTYSVLSLIMVGIIILLLMRYSHINKIQYSIQLLEKRISQQEDEYQLKKVSLEEYTQTNLIEKKAIEELSMSYPKPDQRVYLGIAYDVRDVVNVDDNEVESDSKNSIIRRLLKKLLTKID